MIKWVKHTEEKFITRKKAGQLTKERDPVKIGNVDEAQKEKEIPTTNRFAGRDVKYTS